VFCHLVPLWREVLAHDWFVPSSCSCGRSSGWMIGSVESLANKRRGTRCWAFCGAATHLVVMGTGDMGRLGADMLSGEVQGLAFVAVSTLLLWWHFSSRLLGCLGWYSSIKLFHRDFLLPRPSNFGWSPFLPCLLWCEGRCWWWWHLHCRRGQSLLEDPMVFLLFILGSL
jgi:hypothetical protein